ncbi:MAG: Omp28-related outer membrane protein [Bacteroidales bacterium]|nr:Omp28-related outer membrane protein [Bacteroidales bacterium]
MKKQLLIIIALLTIATLMAQEEKQTFNRKVLIEQFTGADCGYCPAGGDRIAAAISGMSNVVWIKYHAGFGTDFLTNDIATAMTAFYASSTFAPAVMFDRRPLNSSRPGPVMSVGQESDIRGYIASAKEIPTTCKVQTPVVSYNPATRHLGGRVVGRFGDESFNDSLRIVVFIVEDSLIGRQADYYNGTQNAFVHMGTVRDALTDMWGDPFEVSPDGDHDFAYTIDYTLPDDYVYKNCRVVAIVYQYDPEDVNNCPVLNAAQSDYFDRHLGIGEMAEACSLRLFPNPADDVVTVELQDNAAAEGCRIVLTDAMGREVMRQSICGSSVHQLSLAYLPSGIYLLRVETPSGIATRQVVKR